MKRLSWLVASLCAAGFLITTAYGFVPAPRKDTFQVTLPKKYRYPRIAIYGKDTLLADAIATDLYDKGYQVYNTSSTQHLFRKFHLF